MEALDILVPLFTAVLVAVITFLFTRSHYERKRRDDLADRDFSRRVAITDRRIQEARDYVYAWDRCIDFLRKYIRALEERDDIEALYKSVPSSQAYIDLASLLDEASRKERSIEILDNEVLKVLRDGLSASLSGHVGRLEEIMDMIDSKKPIDITKEELETFSAILYGASEMITMMEMTLDELAKTVK